MNSFLPDRVIRRNRALGELMRLCRSVVSDGEVSEEEARRIEQWVEDYPGMIGIAPLNRVIPLLRRIYGDGEVGRAERAELAAILSELSGEDSSAGESWGRLHRTGEHPAGEQEE